jgi:WD40 repeat protein
MAINHRQALVTVFDTSTLETQRELPLEAPRFRPPGWMAFSQSAHTIAYMIESGVVNLFNTETRSNRAVRLPGARRLEGSIVGLSPDAGTLITRGWDPSARWEQSARWWNLADSNQPPKSLEAQRVLFSPDGRTLAAFTRTNGIAIWDVASQKLRTNLIVDPAPGMAAGFSPDGRILALGARNDDVENAVRLLDVQSGKLIGSCLGHKQGIVSVCFSPDGRTLASAGDDSTLRLWNVSSQQELLTIRRLGGTLQALMFSPDGQMLVGSTSFSRRATGIRFFRAPQLKENDLVEINTSSALRLSGMIPGY